MQRNGFEGQKGLIFVMNNQGDGWNGMWVKTKWRNTRFVPGAWRGRDTMVPQEKWTQGEGWGDFWAPPRGYAVYLPQE